MQLDQHVASIQPWNQGRVQDLCLETFAVADNEGFVLDDLREFAGRALIFELNLPEHTVSLGVFPAKLMRRGINIKSIHFHSRHEARKAHHVVTLGTADIHGTGIIPARKTGDQNFENMLVERSLTYFQLDQDGPAEWEPDGDSFFSPCLMEADLMRRVLTRKKFQEWFHLFLPGLLSGELKNLLEPATVSDRSDPKIVHLDGLNLSRAWCMTGVASKFDEASAHRKILLKAAHRHAKSALGHIASGQYEGEHWLASFAVYLLSSLDHEFNRR